jgi:hypothetical protein
MFGESASIFDSEVDRAGRPKYDRFEILEFIHLDHFASTAETRIGPTIRAAEHHQVRAPPEHIFSIAEFMGQISVTEVCRAIPGKERVREAHHVDHWQLRPIRDATGGGDREERLGVLKASAEEGADRFSIPLPKLEPGTSNLEIPTLKNPE